MAIQIEATVHAVKETKQISDKFSKREMIVVLDPSAQYPAYITLEATQRNVDLFDGINKGDRIKADISLNGKLWTDKQGEEKAFTSLNVWRLETIGGSSGNQQQHTNQAPKAQAPDFGDDTPF